MRSSAAPAESPEQNVWTKNTNLRIAAGPAENAPILRSFSGARPTVSKTQDCYTFERFASRPDVIHTTYYYHHKRKRFGFKEETKWS